MTFRRLAAVAVVLASLTGCGTDATPGADRSTTTAGSHKVAVTVVTPTGADEMATIAAVGANLIGQGFVWNESPLHVSTDGGRTWRPATISGVTKGQSITPIVVDDTAFVVGTGLNTPVSTRPAVWRSTDGGVTFTETGPLAPDGKVGAVTTITGIGDRLVAFGFIGAMPEPGTATRWVSDDDGATWTPETVTGVEGWVGSFEPVVVEPDNTLLAVTSVPTSGPVVIRSTDAGATWSPTSMAGGDGASLAISTLPDGRVFVAGPDAVHVSADGGVTWTVTGAVPVVPSGTDRPESSSVDVTGVHDGTIVGVLTSFMNFEEQFDHLVWADPAADTWHLADSPVACTRPEGESEAKSTIAPPVRLGDVLVTTVNCQGVGDPGPTLLESHDDGRTWRRRTVPLSAKLHGFGTRFSAPVALDDTTAVFTATQNVEVATDALVQIRVSDG